MIGSLSKGSRSMWKAHRAVVQDLERRTLLATPSTPHANSITSFDKGERQILLERLDNLGIQSSLRTTLGTGGATQRRNFDNALRDHLLNRTNVKYYFDQGTQQALSAYIINSISYSKPIERADQMVDSRLFPASTNASSYSVTVGGNINYRAPNGARGNTFSQTMNRFEYWGNLADAAMLSGDPAKYVNELSYQLAQWSVQFDGSIDVPSDWNETGKSGWQLVTSIRTEAFVSAYMKVLGSPYWTREDNTLMLYKLMQHGDYLYAQSLTTKADESVDSNKSISLAKSLYLMGRLFPEFDTAAAWESKGRELLIQSMRAQIYADGSHREQTPGYSIGVAEDVLDVYLLDKLNNDTASWTGAPLTMLSNIVESNRQFLSPDGRRPGTGDTYRTFSVSLFLKAGIILDKITPSWTGYAGSYSTSATSITVDDATTFSTGDVLMGAGKTEMMLVTGKSGNVISVQRAVGGTTAQSLPTDGLLYNLDDQPFAKPTIGDFWLLGPVVEKFANVPAIPEGVLGARGKAYAMTDSGNYILRSDDTRDATQITFDAGPKGGFHGHHDLLNFELWSGGNPLIIDPGPYKYDGGADRDYVISTKAHNTVNVDGKNHGWIEGQDQPAIIASHDFQSSFATVTGTHWGYSHLDGSPVLTRSIWYNYGDTMLIVDWAEAASSHLFQQSFNVPGSAEANVSGASGGTEFKTRYNDGSDNVRVKVINGGSLAKGGQTFVTGDSDTDYKLPAYRYTIGKTDDFAVFVTLVNVYTGLTVPNVDAQLVTANPQPGQPIQVNLIRNGSVEQSINFAQPSIARPAANFNQFALVSDVKYDSAGNLHLAYQDLGDKFLKYTVKSATTGAWSPVQVVDDSAPGVGAQIDLEFDNNGAPAIAYYNDATQDLKYAIRSTQNYAWRTQTVDARLTTGQNPSLAFSRSGNSALISYYLRSKGDLKIAMQQTTTDWTISTVDATGDVGRFSKIMLDPNRTDLNSRYVIAYEDRTNNGVRYGYTSGSWKSDLIAPSSITMTGGFVSMAFEDSGSGATSGVGADRFQPRITFYERYPDASLWFAKRDKTTGAWSSQRLDGAGSGKKMGAYSQISYESGKAEIFYFDDKNNQLRRAVQNGAGWLYYTIGDGGREVRVTRRGSAWAVVGYDTVPDKLTLTIV